METAFAKFKQNLKLLQIDQNSRLLLALSGGIDSMALAHLLVDAGIDFAIAHCNFQLRGDASNQDAVFVQNWAESQNKTCFIKKFDVEKHKETHRLSTQMAARNLRYEWFEQLIQTHQFDYLLTAHHLNDSLETFLINLNRGSGIEGLSGIKSSRDTIKRPLFNFSKKELTHYAEIKNLNWREDATNAETDYLRNKIRHEVVPVLKDLNPDFLNRFIQTTQNLNRDHQLIQNHIQSIEKELFENQKDHLSISIEKLNKLQPLDAYLYRLFEAYGFKHPQEIQKLIDSEHQGEITSSTHRLIKNRANLLLSPKMEQNSTQVIELNPDSLIEKPLYLRLAKSNQRDEMATESLDLDQISFPMRLRKPEVGDEFQPLGMKGKKKLSKYFKDEKFSKLDKENTWILTDAHDQILYLIGKRIDERYKITKHTQNILNIYLC